MYKVTGERYINSDIIAGDGGKDESKAGLSVTDKNYHRQSDSFKQAVSNKALIWQDAGSTEYRAFGPHNCQMPPATL